MKYIQIVILFLLYSCTKNNVEGRVYDYDTSKPIKNVQIIINDNKTQTDSAGYFSLNVNSNQYVIQLKRDGYTEKRVSRKGNYFKSDIIYLYKKDSDFSLKK